MTKQKFLDYLDLAKPRVTALNLIVAAGAYAFVPEPGPFSRFVATMLGVGFVIGSANTLNCWLERESDKAMERTRDRPLPAGRLEAWQALAFGVGLAIAGLVVLALGANVLTALIAGLALVSYVGIYTPMKAHSAVALIVGAIPGAAPALLGATGSTGRIEATGLWLFLTLFLWQLPHFISISLYRSDEYTAAGLKVFPNTVGLARSRRALVRFQLGAVAASLGLWASGATHLFYLVAASVLGAAMLAFAARGLWTRDVDRWARRFFIGTNVYLTLLFGALGLDKLLG